MKRNTICCDVCEADVSGGVWMSLHGADIQPLDFCSWDCTADYARLQASEEYVQAQLTLEPPC